MDPARVWFTSGGTEANNTAVLGGPRAPGGTVLVGSTEHESVLRAADLLTRQGRNVTHLPPRDDGSIDPDAVMSALDEDVVLVSVMAANNETGAISKTAEIAAICRDRGVPIHTDAVQTAAYDHVSPDVLGVDFVTVSAHKLGGPVGIGALLLGSKADCVPMVVGGRQERGRRAGTENVAAIVGFAEAVRLAVDSMASEKSRIEHLRLRLADGLAAGLGDAVHFTTVAERSAPHILHCTFPDRNGMHTDGEMLLLRLDMEGVQASSGSACTSGALEPSHVLLATGRTRQEASTALRLSLGRTTTVEEIDRAVPIIAKTVRHVTA